MEIEVVKEVESTKEDCPLNDQALTKLDSGLDLSEDNNIHQCNTQRIVMKEEEANGEEGRGGIPTR